MASQTFVYQVGMTCDGCANQVKKVIGKLGDKVSNLDINVDEKTVKVTTTMTQEEIMDVLKKTGKSVEIAHST